MDWDEIIRDEPISFLKACYFDDELRNVQAEGLKNMQNIPYFHYSRRPLREVYFAQFEAISQEYTSQLSEWVNEWQEFLRVKYSQVA